jgi:hypothetical protein
MLVIQSRFILTPEGFTVSPTRRKIGHQLRGLAIRQVFPVNAPEEGVCFELFIAPHLDATEPFSWINNLLMNLSVLRTMKK